MRSKANTIAMTATWVTVRTSVLFGLCRRAHHRTANCQRLTL